MARFIQRANDVQVNEFTQFDTDAISENVKSWQNRYDMTKEAMAKQREEFGKITAYDLDARNNYMANYRREADELAALHGGNLALSTPMVMDFIATKAGDTYHQVNQHHVATMDRFLDTKYALEAQGIGVLAFQKPGDRIRETTATGGTAYRNIADITYHTEGKLEDSPIMESMFDQVVADGSAGYSEGTILAGDVPVMTKTSWEGITEQKIRNYLDSAFERYQSTNNYRQRVLEYTHADYGYDGKQLTKEEADAVIKEQLLSAGLERVYNKTDADRTVVPQPANRAGNSSTGGPGGGSILDNIFGRPITTGGDVVNVGEQNHHMNEVLTNLAETYDVDAANVGIAVQLFQSGVLDLTEEERKDPELAALYNTALALGAFVEVTRKAGEYHLEHAQDEGYVQLNTPEKMANVKQQMEQLLTRATTQYNEAAAAGKIKDPIFNTERTLDSAGNFIDTAVEIARRANSDARGGSPYLATPEGRRLHQLANESPGAKENLRQLEAFIKENNPDITPGELTLRLFQAVIPQTANQNVANAYTQDWNLNQALGDNVATLGRLAPAISPNGVKQGEPVKLENSVLEYTLFDPQAGRAGFRYRDRTTNNYSSVVTENPDANEIFNYYTGIGKFFGQGFTDVSLDPIISDRVMIVQNRGANGAPATNPDGSPSVSYNRQVAVPVIDAAGNRYVVVNNVPATRTAAEIQRDTREIQRAFINDDDEALAIYTAKGYHLLNQADVAKEMTGVVNNLVVDPQGRATRGVRTDYGTNVDERSGAHY